MRLVSNLLKLLIGFWLGWGVYSFMHPEFKAIKVDAATKDSTCPVTSAVPNLIGGAVVAFNCGSVIITVYEPKWP